MSGKLVRLLYLLLLVWVALGIGSLYIPPHFFWPAGFVALSLPVALALNALFLGFWLFRRKWTALLPAGLLLLCLGFYNRILRVNFSDNAVAENAATLQVLGYNVRVFNIYNHLHSEDRKETNDLVNYVRDHPADVICLQEFFNNIDARELQSTKILRKTRKHHFVSVAQHNVYGNEFGLAIFSKHKIVGKGTIRFGRLTPNHAMYIDIKVKDDTVRVYNFHLQSMAIEERHMPVADDDGQELKVKSSNLLKRLKAGFIARSKQVQQLREHIAQSPYRVIAAGDLNDLPLSYTYQQLLHELHNAFDVAGSGMGVTYGGHLPFLRIDNQFFSKNLNIVSFQVLDSVSFTDHYPTLGVYELSK